MSRAKTASGILEDPKRPESIRESGIDLHAQYYAERTGGDVFDSVRIGRRVTFMLSDIAGRKPEVDLISAEMQKAFRATSAELLSTVDVNLTEATEMLIYAVNQALIGAAKGARFAPTMVGCYDVQLGILAYINAGGQTALLRDSEGTRALPNVSVPLGLFTHMPYDASIQAFEPGAVLLVVTKGVTECMGGKIPFGRERVIAALQSSKQGSASGVCSAVLDAAHQFKKRRWAWLPYKKNSAWEDMTVLAMMRLE